MGLFTVPVKARIEIEADPDTRETPQRLDAQLGQSPARARSAANGIGVAATDYVRGYPILIARLCQAILVAGC